MCVRAFSRVLSWMEKCVYLLGEGGGRENLEKGTFNRSVGESNIRIFVEILLDSRLETKNRKVNSVELKF